MPITFASFESLPALLQEYLQSDVLAAVNNEILDEGIPDDKTDAVLDATYGVFLGKTSLEKFPQALSAALGKAPQEVMPLAAEIAVRVFQPASEYFGPVEAYVRRWNEEMLSKQFTTTIPALSLPRYTREELIARFIEMRPRSVTNPKAVARYEKLAEEIVYRGRSNFDEAQFRSALVGNVEENGVGLSADEADGVLLRIKQEFAASNTLRTVTRAAAPMPKEADMHTAAAADVQDAARTVREKLGPTAGAHEPAEQSLQQDILAKLASVVPAENQSELVSVVGARIKHARDARATMDVLLRSKEQGGLGLNSDTAMAALTIIEEALHAQTQQMAPKPQTTEQKKPAEQRPVVAQLATQKQIGATHEDTLRTAPQQPPAPKPVQTSGQELSSIATASVADQPYVFGKEKPRLEDVRKVQALTGPVQEIGSLRLVDFRRSAQNPEVRMEKILSAIQRIGEESYADKIQAISAWRHSEPYQLYEDMLIEALRDKKPLVVVTQERIKARRPVLEKEEFSAILQSHGALEDW